MRLTPAASFGLKMNANVIQVLEDQVFPQLESIEEVLTDEMI
ncbi:hypothetical protein [Candidatus Methylacidiphilum fumarolicum]|nr:hypothetical protein [Candidatus Methylacidiphilum fumarolicum]